MNTLRLILALPFTLVGLLLLCIGALIGGAKMADIILTSFRKHLLV